MDEEQQNGWLGSGKQEQRKHTCKAFSDMLILLSDSLVREVSR